MLDQTDHRTPAERAAQDLRVAHSAARSTLEQLEDDLDQVDLATTRALRVAETATAEQRTRAERAEDALRTLRLPPGDPVTWRSKGATVRVVATERRADVRAFVGLDAASQVFGQLSEASEAAIVTLRPAAGQLDAREVALELWLGLAPGGALDQLADTLGRLIQERDARAHAERVARAAESISRPIAGSAT